MTSIKYHDYFRGKDKCYRRLVWCLKILLLLFAMLSTIVLGLKGNINIDCRVNIGLVFSASITFLTAILSYFNLEEYWMRNIAIHIELNILRDNFAFEAQSGKFDDSLADTYRQKLERIQNDNMRYWQKALKKI